MKEYQARIEIDGPVMCAFTSENEARAWFRGLPTDDLRRTYICILAEWETEAEADKARLDWINTFWVNGLARACVDSSSNDIRIVIDTARNAPQTKCAVIEFMDDAHGLILLQSEEDEIRRAVHEDDAEFLRQAMGRDADCLPEIERRAHSAKLSNDFGGMA